MRVLLISSNTETINMPVYPAGLYCVALALLREGHTVEILDLLDSKSPEQDVAEAVRNFSPAVIGISVRNIDNQDMEDTRFLLEPVKSVVDACKQSTDAPVVLGGAGYSMYPQSALAYLGADMGISGEGENAFCMLVHRIENGLDVNGIPGLYQAGIDETGPENRISDLDAFPIPDPGSIAGSIRNTDSIWLPYQTRRGCPLDCSYCSTGNIEGRRLRKRSIPQITANLAQWEKVGVRHFFFADNTFNLPPNYAKALCRAIIDAKLDIRWRCIIYPKQVDKELSDLMAKAGCAEVSLGFESASPKVLNALNKKFGPLDIEQASARLAAAGITRMGFLLLGGPGETRDTVEQSLAFVEKLELDMLKLTIGIRIYPDTALARQAVKEGIIRPDDTLLSPRFYLSETLKEWLPGRVKEWARKRPGLVV